MPAPNLLRHIVATLAYRGGKAIRDAPDTFPQFQASPTSRTPVQILAHIGDLLDWSLSTASGRQFWRANTPQSWDDEGQRFFAALKAFDDCIATADPATIPAERLLQGPIADALTHVGQLAMLRRIAGCPMKGENYYVADIQAGVVGADQAAPRRGLE